MTAGRMQIQTKSAQNDVVSQSEPVCSGVTPICHVQQRSKFFYPLKKPNNTDTQYKRVLCLVPPSSLEKPDDTIIHGDDQKDSTRLNLKSGGGGPRPLCWCLRMASIEFEKVA